ncbi:MAG: STAS/SEC14 domain-containing protein [Planctomycetia bacterium]|nr:STAS/SEC14 domain-containing protein [Planctomycetia bacterium]
MTNAIDIQTEGKMLLVKATGKLTKEAYQEFVPLVEQMVHQHGKVRILFAMHDFHGWEAGALWEDMKFDLKHFRDIERLAIVGETKWEKGMAMFCAPFTTAKIKYFDVADIDAATIWLRSDEAAK